MGILLENIRAVNIFFLDIHYAQHVHVLCWASCVSIGHLVYVVATLVMDTPSVKTFY